MRRFEERGYRLIGLKYMWANKERLEVGCWVRCWTKAQSTFRGQIILRSTQYVRQGVITNLLYLSTQVTLGSVLLPTKLYSWFV
jgi:hypothetical protein